MAGGGPTPAPTPTAPSSSVGGPVPPVSGGGTSRKLGAAHPLSSAPLPPAGAAPPPMDGPAPSPVGPPPPPPPPPPLKGSSLTSAPRPSFPCAGEAQPPTGAAVAPARPPSAAVSCKLPPVPPSGAPLPPPPLERSGPTPAPPIPPEAPVSSHATPTASSTASSTAPLPAPANVTVAHAPRPPAPKFTPPSSSSSTNSTWAAAPSPSTVVAAVEKYGLSITGTAVACAAIFFPFLHLLLAGDDLEATMALWKVEGIEIGLANNLLWLLYSVVVLPRDQAYDTILGNSWAAAVNLSLLLVMYARKKMIRRGMFMLGGTLAIIVTCLIMFQINVSTNKWMEIVFGVAGLAALLGTHILQICDLCTSAEQRQLIPPLLTVLPNFGFAALQIITCFVIHKDILIIMLSAYLNIGGYAFELILLFNVHIIISQRSVPVLKKMQVPVLKKLHRMNAFKHTSTLRAWLIGWLMVL